MTENSSHTGFGTFLLTRLLRGATTSGPFCGDGKHDFYSHASCEARRAQFPIFGVPQYFYSHASCEARRIARQYYDEHKDISTHTPLARRDPQPQSQRNSEALISTHTPLARRDQGTSCPSEQSPISTHTPLARRDCHLNSPL